MTEYSGHDVLTCAVCHSRARFWREVDGHTFTVCEHCGSIALNASRMDRIDSGEEVRLYDQAYWEDEMRAAHERCWGSSVARAVEAILLCRRPVKRFIDLGCGAGSLLDALSFYLPNSRHIFYGVEKYPPARHTSHPGFLKADIAAVEASFDCGVCIEVVEHLTPRMLGKFVQSIAKMASPDSLFIFNTGLAPFVQNGNADYIDPVRRGHIVSYGWRALEQIFSAQGFQLHRLGQRDWAFAVEFRPSQESSISDRKWHPLPENNCILIDQTTGMVPAILARESLRAYE